MALWISPECEGLLSPGPGEDEARHDLCEEPAECACPCHEGDEEP
jgi:hypothetical protein